MAKNTVLGPLSIGNVVSAALRIYRDHFKSYFSLAAKAYLWVLLPIYGWAKYSAISALISRLAYQEALERPETSSQAQPIVERRKWSLLGQGFLLFLIFLGSLLGLIIASGIVIAILGGILGSNNPLVVLIGVVLALVALFVYVWLLSKLCIAPLPLAVEDNMTATAAIRRSWTLTQGSVLRIQGVLFVAFLITLPLSVIFQIAVSLLQVVFAFAIPQDSPVFITLYFIFTLAMSLLNAALFLPFWQAIAGVIYYDLRARREGLGIDLKLKKDRKPRQ